MKRSCSYLSVVVVFLGCSFLTSGVVLGEGPAPGAAVDYDKTQVGEEPDGRVVVPTNQILSPLGEQVVFSGRPTDVAISPDARWLGVLCNDKVLVVDLDTNSVAGQAPFTGSFTGIRFSPKGDELFASNTRGTIGVFSVDDKGGLKGTRKIQLTPKPSGKGRGVVPAGMALDPNGKTLWVAYNLKNQVAEIDPASGKELRKIDVGNAPYDVACAAGKVYVSNWAGRLPKPGDRTGPSGRAGPVRVDRRYIASEGSVSVVDPKTGRAVKEIVVGPHASGLAASPDGRYVCVACANADTVVVIDTTRDEPIETISTRPARGLLLGSAPNAVTFAPDGKTLYVSNGTNNAVAVVAFEPPQCRVEGFLPAGWYPAGLVVDPKRNELCVANVKGIGSRPPKSQRRRTLNGKTVWGYRSRDCMGTISLMPLPEANLLAWHTQAVLANNRLEQSRLAQAKPRPSAPPRPVPERVGEPSIFKHVLYIIKENRTYDQVFGDVPEGEGDPSLCIFGERITPNLHKLAREFVLLDNFYCSGVLSADGHQWTDEAYVTDYIEKSFGGWPRSYPYWGGDAMAYAGSGFIWDNALARDKTVRVYGEFVKATVRWKDPKRKGRPNFTQCYRDYRDGTGKIEIRATAAIKTLEPHICPTAIGFPGIVTDQYRADQFLAELKEFEADGKMPNLMIMLLPNDHTSGTRPGMPTPAAAVADNDLAVGRIVEAISHSRFWPSTCIFVVEDDPQAGFDHIDGHRTVAMVVSPYTRRHAVDSTNYNQTSMVRTIEQILGLPPMNQLDASATPMASCFTSRPNFEPYRAVKNNIPLDQMNPKLAELKDPRATHWAKASMELPLDDIDEADEDTLNRILWFAQKGRDDTYPAWAVLDVGDED